MHKNENASKWESQKEIRLVMGYPGEAFGRTKRDQTAGEGPMRGKGSSIESCLAAYASASRTIEPGELESDSKLELLNISSGRDVSR